MKIVSVWDKYTGKGSLIGPLIKNSKSNAVSNKTLSETKTKRRIAAYVPSSALDGAFKWKSTRNA